MLVDQRGDVTTRTPIGPPAHRTPSTEWLKIGERLVGDDVPTGPGNRSTDNCSEGVGRRDVDDGGPWTSKMPLEALTKMVRVRVLRVTYPDGSIGKFSDDTEDRK